jgi:AAHS family 4-hydroxybenzoate transporter-like MFS transporter
MNLLLAYFLSSWLTTVVRGFGYATSTAVWVGTTMQIGGVVGTIILVRLIARTGFRRVLTASFLLGAVAIALIGRSGSSFGLLLFAVCVAGGCIIGGQPALNALSGTYYPTYLRATAIGWALGIGRSGAIVGPIIAAELIRRQWSPPDLFLAAALPAIACAILFFTWRHSAAGGVG